MKNVKSNMTVLHSRFAEAKRGGDAVDQEASASGAIDLLPNDQAHPCMDTEGKIVLFHNGQVANGDELLKEIDQNKDISDDVKASLKKMTDSQFVTFLLSQEMKAGKTLKEAL